MLAEDDNSYAPATRPFEPGEHEEAMDEAPQETVSQAERLLFCGWRRDLHDMIICLDEFVQQGSQLWLYNNVRPGKPCPLHSEATGC